MAQQHRHVLDGDAFGQEIDDVIVVVEDARVDAPRRGLPFDSVASTTLREPRARVEGLRAAGVALDRGVDQAEFANLLGKTIA